jgi:hypothetical protein
MLSAKAVEAANLTDQISAANNEIIELEARNALLLGESDAL